MCVVFLGKKIAKINVSCFLYKPGICTQKFCDVTWGPFVCSILWNRASDRWKLKNTKKLCTNQWLSMLFSHAGSPLKAHSWLRRCTNLNASNIKIFVAHLTVIGLVKKTNMAKYWRTNSLTRTPFFGKILSRNTFQYIPWNLHISDNNTDYPHENLNHDPSHKVRPFIQMCERTFQLVYRPGCDLSFDEACCPFKGRVQFCVYNANNLAKFHMKLFQISEAKSRYICAFDIYIGKDQARCTQTAQVLNPSCTTTSKLGVGLMDSVHLVDKGHCMCMDNLYTSPKLYAELFFHSTYACGTVLPNRKGMPK